MVQVDQMAAQGHVTSRKPLPGRRTDSTNCLYATSDVTYR